MFLDFGQATDEITWMKNHNAYREYLLVKVEDTLDDDLPF